MLYNISMQRLRIRFSRGEELKFISHLDIMRLWQRAFNRAGISIAYSEGFNPHPRISLAAPLAVGVTSEAELMDIIVARQISPHWFTDTMNQTLPPAIRITQVLPMMLEQPSLQSLVSFAEYRVEVDTDKSRQEMGKTLDGLLALEHLPWQHQRDTGIKNYDLRTLIDDLWLEDWQQGFVTIGMRLRCDSSGSGRPEQVAAALGFPAHPHSIHRTRLILRTG